MTDKQPAARVTPEDAFNEAMARYPKTMAALARPATAPGSGAWVPAEQLAEAKRQIAAMTERDRALREAALRVLAWVNQVAGDNRRPDEAAEELASVEALSAILASTGDAA